MIGFLIARIVKKFLRFGAANGLQAFGLEHGRRVGTPQELDQRLSGLGRLAAGADSGSEFRHAAEFARQFQQMSIARGSA